MNYQKIYNSIIENSKKETRNKINSYYEKHHIIPRCIGGSNKEENLALLTPKEHFICHCLLVNIYKQDVRIYIKMLQALNMMKVKHKHHERYLNSKLYEKYRNKLYGQSGLLKGKNHYMYGRTHTKETKKIISVKRREYCQLPKERFRLKEMAINRTLEHQEKINLSNKGQKRTLEARKRMSDAHKNLQLNEKNGMSKRCCIEGIVYPSVREAHRKLGGDVNTIYYRINSKNFKEYKWIGVSNE